VSSQRTGGVASDRMIVEHRTNTATCCNSPCTAAREYARPYSGRRHPDANVCVDNCNSDAVKQEVQHVAHIWERNENPNARNHYVDPDIDGRVI
jgi:hypothetical protein